MPGGDMLGGDAPNQAHFVQGGDGPVLLGTGAGTLRCACGSTLIEGFTAAGFLGLGIRCARCGTLTTTAGLPEGQVPPRSAIVATAAEAPRTTAMTVPRDVPVVGHAEMQRWQSLLQPAVVDNAYSVSGALLDETAAVFERHLGAVLPDPGNRSADSFDGLKTHPLGWAVGYLRRQVRQDTWACMQDAPTAAAVTHVTGFLHMAATWSRHPLLPAMLTAAGERGFSLHALAPFAAAHGLMKMGNRIRFGEPTGNPATLCDFALVIGNEPAAVQLEVFDRFEFPFGQPWNPTVLREAVQAVLGSAQGRINLRHPGLLLLSPGSALAGYDEALIEAVKHGVQMLGRRNRGLLAVMPVTLRLQALADRQAARLVYGLFPTANRHYRGDGQLQMRPSPTRPAGITG